MATDLERQIKAALASLERELKVVESTVIPAINALVTVGRSLAQALKPIASKLAKILSSIGAAVGAVVHFISNVFEIAELGDRAQELGIDVERLQELQFAAENSTVSVQDLEQGLAQLKKQLDEVANGNQKTIGALKELDIDARGLDDQVRGVGAVFDDLVEKLSNVTSAAERKDILSQLFGQELGPRLDPLFRRGKAAIDADARSARDSFGFLTAEDVKLAQFVAASYERLAKQIPQDLQKQFEQLQRDLERFWEQLNRSATAALLQAGESITEWVKELRTELEKLSSGTPRSENRPLPGRDDIPLRGGIDGAPEPAFFGPIPFSRDPRQEHRPLPGRDDIPVRGLFDGALLDGDSNAIESALASRERHNELVERYRAMLPELVLQVGDATLAQELLNGAVAEAEERMTGEIATLDRMRGETGLTDQAIVGLTGSLFQQAQALLQNADSWQDWAKGALGAVETVLQAVLGAEGKGGGSGGGLGGIFDILGGLFGLGGGGGGFTTGNIGGLSGTPFITNSFGTFVGLAGRQHGGPLAAGQFAIVGERGPELFVPRLPGRVFSSGQTRSMLVGGGEVGAGGLSLVQNITINGRLTAAERTENLAQAREMGFAAVNAYRASINRGGPDAKLSGRRRGQ